MDREIKFRFWLPEGEMHYSDNMADYYIGSWIVKDSIVKMQYTGLTDKIGTEIYEGDIVKRKLVDRFPTEFELVRYSKGSFIPFDGSDYSWTTNSVEVIGNKFEDPELIDDNE